MLPAEVIPLLLSTMKLPEMEAEEQAQLQEHASQLAVKGAPGFYEELGVSKNHQIQCSESKLVIL